MTIADLIGLVSNKLAALNVARANAVSVGDIDAIARIDAQITQTQETLDQLRTL